MWTAFTMAAGETERQDFPRGPVLESIGNNIMSDTTPFQSACCRGLSVFRLSPQTGAVGNPLFSVASPAPAALCLPGMDILLAWRTRPLQPLSAGCSPFINMELVWSPFPVNHSCSPRGQEFPESFNTWKCCQRKATRTCLWEGEPENVVFNTFFFCESFLQFPYCVSQEK